VLARLARGAGAPPPQCRAAARSWAVVRAGLADARRAAPPSAGRQQLGRRPQPVPQGPALAQPKPPDGAGGGVRRPRCSGQRGMALATGHPLWEARAGSGARRLPRAHRAWGAPGQLPPRTPAADSPASNRCRPQVPAVRWPRDDHYE
jgi:hypothetical protein